VRWQDRITNEEVTERTVLANINTVIKKRRCRYIGHLLRMDNKKISRKALRWTPAGKRKIGRPKDAWRRTVEAEIKERGYSRQVIEREAKDLAAMKVKMSQYFNHISFFVNVFHLKTT